MIKKGQVYMIIDTNVVRFSEGNTDPKEEVGGGLNNLFSA